MSSACGQTAVLLDIPHPLMLSQFPPEKHLVAKSGTNLDPVDQYSPDTPTPLSAPILQPQYRHLVVKSGTTVGQHHMSPACRVGCCFVRCTSQVEASAGQEMYYIMSA